MVKKKWIKAAVQAKDEVLNHNTDSNGEDDPAVITRGEPKKTMRHKMYRSGDMKK